MNKEHPNIEVLKKLDLSNMEACAEVLAEDLVWHYFNPELPELHGDYYGIEGFGNFFNKMGQNTGATFKVNVISTTPMGDEMVVTHVKDTMFLKGRNMEVDAVVVWSIADGQIQEAWDIPAMHSVKIKES
ncbi:MAG: nuclear transport factor 2 family protein [Deltaproteobacteria bacterium]|nr:nuclear transport factor 2 family protein [Deltaproteobacteria bacterium]